MQDQEQRRIEQEEAREAARIAKEQEQLDKQFADERAKERKAREAQVGTDMQAEQALSNARQGSIKARRRSSFAGTAVAAVADEPSGLSTIPEQGPEPSQHMGRGRGRQAQEHGSPEQQVQSSGGMLVEEAMRRAAAEEVQLLRSELAQQAAHLREVG